MTLFRRVGITVAVVLTIALAAGCSQPAATPSAGTRLANTDWLLSSISGTPIPSGTNLDLIFGITQASGSGGCNRFTASYASDGVSTLSFGPFATTQMACVPPTDALERAYLNALGNVARYAMTSDSLTLSNATGGPLLIYAAQAPATVEGPWNVTMVNNGNQGVESIPAGISASVAFGADGNVEGFGGCNNFSGSYTVDGDKITIGPLMSTLAACDDATNQFEMQLLAALQNATTWSVTTGTLELRDDGGALQVSATSAIGN